MTALLLLLLTPNQQRESDTRYWVSHFAYETGVSREWSVRTAFEPEGPWPAWTRADTNLAPGRGFVVTFDASRLRQIDIRLLAAHEVCHILRDGPVWYWVNGPGRSNKRGHVQNDERATWACAYNLVRAYGEGQ